MARPCSNCFRHILFTFAETVTQSSRPQLRFFSSANIRALSTEISETASTRAKTLSDFSDSDPVTIATWPQKSRDIEGWQKERQSIFATKAGLEANHRAQKSSRNAIYRTKHGSEVAPKIPEDGEENLEKERLRRGTTDENQHHGRLKSNARASAEAVRGTKQPWQLKLEKKMNKKRALGGGHDLETSLRQADLAKEESSGLPKGRLADGSKDRWRRRQEQSLQVLDAEDHGSEKTAQRSDEYSASIVKDGFGSDIQAESAGKIYLQKQRAKDVGSETTSRFPMPTKLNDPETSIRAKISPNAPEWLKHRESIKRKHNGAAWDPIKKLSPDAMEGVRQLHSADPVLWSTPNLAEHFKVSPEAIRRIIKSKWRANERERQAQEERWIKRGEAIWDRYVELGRKAPRKWRGLNPVPAEKKATAMNGPKVVINPEEWSQDRDEQDQESAESGLGASLGRRIM